MPESRPNGKEFFRLFPDRILGSLFALGAKPAEWGGYVRLYFASWSDGLPSCDEELRRIAGFTPHLWRRFRGRILAQFVLIDGRYYDEDLREQSAKIDRFREVCAEAAARRWQQRAAPQPSPRQLPIDLFLDPGTPAAIRKNSQFFSPQLGPVEPEVRGSNCGLERLCDDIHSGDKSWVPMLSLKYLESGPPFGTLQVAQAKGFSRQIEIRKPTSPLASSAVDAAPGRTWLAHEYWSWYSGLAHYAREIEVGEFEAVFGFPLLTGPPEWRGNYPVAVQPRDPAKIIHAALRTHWPGFFLPVDPEGPYPAEVLVEPGRPHGG